MPIRLSRNRLCTAFIKLGLCAAVHDGRHTWHWGVCRSGTAMQAPVEGWSKAIERSSSGTFRNKRKTSWNDAACTTDTSWTFLGKSATGIRGRHRPLCWAMLAAHESWCQPMTRSRADAHRDFMVARTDGRWTKQHPCSPDLVISKIFKYNISSIYTAAYIDSNLSSTI